jgi:hypothetical protein
MKTMNREQWLNEAAAKMKGWVMDAPGGEDYPDPLVSVGFPKGSRGGGANNAIGQCWDKSVSGDKERAHIFIIPTMVDPKEILAVLLHELVHASVGTKCGHKGAFKTCAVGVGLEGKMTATVAGEFLGLKLELLSRELGEYPHPGLEVPKRGSKGSRLLKVSCDICGYIARVTAKWALYPGPGPPYCPCSDRQMRLDEERN